MKFWEGLGTRIIKMIEKRQKRKQLKSPGALGDWYRNGGNSQYFENLPLNEKDWAWDVGGYFGDWSKGILTMYGCRIELFEPIPAFVAECRRVFAKNSRVLIHEAALGTKRRTANFSLLSNGTSEFSNQKKNCLKTKVVDVNEELNKRIKAGKLEKYQGSIGCMNLNIEGGEYDILEKLIRTKEIRRFRCLLIQFHRQPEGYHIRYKKIIQNLSKSHCCVWAYPFVWERWDLRT